MRRLRSSMVSAGKVYPAGAKVTDAFAERIKADVFEEGFHEPDPETDADEATSTDDDGDQDEHDEARQVVAELIRDAVDEAVRPLLERIEQLQVQPEGTPDSPPVELIRITGDYDDHRVDELRGEVDARNAGLEPDSTGYIVVGGKGNKPDVVAALEAHDAAVKAAAEA